MPTLPEAKVLPVFAPNTVAAVVSKFNVSQAGLEHALKSYKPSVLPVVLQPRTNAVIVLPSNVPLRPDVVMSNSASRNAASAACHATCISRSLRAPRSLIKAIWAPPTPSSETMIKIIMTTIRDAPRWGALREKILAGSGFMIESPDSHTLGIAQMHRKGEHLAQTAICRGSE